MESDRGKKKFIEKIDLPDTSSSVSNSSDILTAFRDFYVKLFTEEAINFELADSFCENLPRLNALDMSMCEGPIEKQEILVALRHMRNNKSPGSDGLTKEFYLTFFDLLGDQLVLLYNAVFQRGELCDTQKLSYISLLCKDPNNSCNMKNWRPISLLNIDYKILSKVITNRLGKVIDKLVGTDQTCAIRERSIFENCHLLRNIVDYVDQKDLKCAFISLDQEKAFDRVNYDFLFKVLTAFNFGPDFIRWVSVLYKNVHSSVIVNGFISDPFPITRGVRQGCSLSPLLYVLVLEPFAKKVRDDPEIIGIKLPGSSQSAKISLYADDSTGICCTVSSISKLFSWCDLYGRASGAKLNKQKSKGIWLGKWKSRSDHPFGISWVEKHKICGVLVGNNITPDDIWQPVFKKLSRTLDLWKLRNLSFTQKSIVIKVLACSKIWYIGTVVIMPRHYLELFQRILFRFLWNSKSEPLARSVAYASPTSGGLAIVNIKVKLQAIYLKHLQNFIFKDTQAKWRYFTMYWLSLDLREYFSSVDNNSPHSKWCPTFYTRIYIIFKKYIKDFPKSNIKSVTTKELYGTLLSGVITTPRIVRIFPTIDFAPVFLNISNKFLDTRSRDVVFKIVHEILPVNFRMYRFGVESSKYCTFCSGFETISHLFFECPFIQPLVSLVNSWIHQISENKIPTDSALWRFHSPVSLTLKVKTLVLFLVAESLSSIWNIRCVKKYDRKSPTSNSLVCHFLSSIILRIRSDFARFPINIFSEYWCTTDIFCAVRDDELIFNLPL
ncbi:hypothetical protein CI610_03342 [invertebrate metagenome]|uniref:Reverse transcriptase domain-containing protein n=1 Tax=invertebrate metagenome TaxID=1711999 RepID=A0A2H9T3C7_9ZZZZ